MKKHCLAHAVLCIVLLTGCGTVGEKVSSFIENDANIGKNAPAVVGTIADIDEKNEVSTVTEKVLSEEEKAQLEADKKRQELLSRAEEILSEMTVEEKIGQMLLARFPENAVEQMEKYHFGGYTLYANDFENENKDSIKEYLSEISDKASVAPFFAVDEEGGKVVRVSKFSQYRDEPFSSPQLLFRRGGTELLEIDTEEKAKLLKSMGLNLNLAPVADISTDESSYIYPRTIGMGAEDTAAGISAIVSTANQNDLASCLKHFPGYGENTDTHKSEAHDARELYEFYNRDFVPFRAGIEADSEKTPAVMVGHTVYDMIDEGVPASLSPVIHEALRSKLEFDGVVVTDDMSMDALLAFSSESSPYVLAVQADNDLLCVTDAVTAYNDLKAAYDEGVLSDEEIDRHVKRIIVMKLQYNIIK